MMNIVWTCIEHKSLKAEHGGNNAPVDESESSVERFENQHVLVLHDFHFDRRMHFLDA